MMKKLDSYILKKYFLTYIFTTALLMLIVIVIDFSEKLSDFIEKEAPLNEIVIYFLTFIPHMAALLAPLFLFVSVILFTSKMASNSEIVGILGNGISFYRMLRPFLFGAIVLTMILIFANNWLVPEANKIKNKFLKQYVFFMSSTESGINLTLDKKGNKETIVSIPNFSFSSMEGYQFSMEKYENNKMVMQIRAPRIRWHDDTQNWEISNYEQWHIDGEETTLRTGKALDTVLGFTPKEFVRRLEMKETMNYDEIKTFIKKEKDRNTDNYVFFEIEHYNRTSNAFAIIILTLIGVAFSSRKKRGATGINIAIGLLLSGLYMLLLRFSSTFATNANLPAIIAVWIPNVIFGILAIILIKKAPK
jgi:lipopolysaccharide export system permease protein